MKSLALSLFLIAAAPFAFAETGVVFQSSFEAPEVMGRIPKEKGGDIARQGEKPDWLHFDDAGTQPKPAKENKGALLAGVTSEQARTGNQSFFIQADRLSAQLLATTFSSRPIHVVPGESYKVSFWGKNDHRSPLTIQKPQIILKMELAFFSDDEAETQTGDSQYFIQALPGDKGDKTVLTDKDWSQFTRGAIAPDDARTLLVIWKCEAGTGKGSITGAAYFDDLSVEGEIPPEEETAPAATPAPAQEEPSTGAMLEGVPVPALTLPLETDEPTPAPESSPAPEPSPAHATPQPHHP